MHNKYRWIAGQACADRGSRIESRAGLVRGDEFSARNDTAGVYISIVYFVNLLVMPGSIRHPSTFLSVQ